MTSPENSPEHPWPVRSISLKVAQWIDRLGAVWVEGQITQLNLRPGTRTAFIVLRDPAADMSIQVTCPPSLITGAEVPLTEGSRVVVFGKFSFYTGRGSLSLRVTEIRPVGIGELLARIARLRALLEAEGLFDPRLKRPIPFLPNRIGLITGRASAAERDVVTVAQSRWPAVDFTIINTPVQGASAVPKIVDALAKLDADPEVDVIVLARGGGSVEDLLPFSDETLVRAIAKATTPIVSAIGHEPDTPISDFVADLRAATPTDAAKRIVPDAEAERALVVELRERARAALRGWVRREQNRLDELALRPVLARPIEPIVRQEELVERLIGSVRRDTRRMLEHERTQLGHYRARLSTLGPAATMARGYAVVQKVVPGAASHVLREASDAPPGTQIRVRLADGALQAAVLSSESIAKVDAGTAEPPEGATK